MWRVVLDTSVLVAAMRSRSGASARLLGMVSERRLVPLMSQALFLEYEEVLMRPGQLVASGLTGEQVGRALAALAAAAEPVEVHFTWRPQLLDENDEFVLEAAINGRADALVTHNIADFAGAGPRFGVPVLTPGALLKRISL